MKKLAILGASGHGKVIADAAECAGWAVAFFDDAREAGTFCRDWPIHGNTEDLTVGGLEYDGVIVGVGDNATRLAKTQLLIESGCAVVTIIHPRSVVSDYAAIGVGSAVLAGSVINVDCTIGIAAIISTGATIDHDCHLDNGVHVSPGANLAGGVSVGERSWIGIGSCVKEQIVVGKNVVVGAGSSVVRDVPDDQTVVGSPARPLGKPTK